MEPDKSVAKLADVTAMLTSSVGLGMKVQLANATADGITVLLVNAETGASIEFKQKWGSRSKALQSAVSRAPDLLPPKPSGPRDVIALDFIRVLQCGDRIYVGASADAKMQYAKFIRPGSPDTRAFEFKHGQYAHLRSIYMDMGVEYAAESVIEVWSVDNKREKRRCTLAEFIALAE
jgi:hypothetical protein